MSLKKRRTTEVAKYRARALATPRGSKSRVQAAKALHWYKRTGRLAHVKRRARVMQELHGGKW